MVNSLHGVLRLLMFFWCFSGEPTSVTVGIWPRRMAIDLTLDSSTLEMVSMRHLVYWAMGLLYVDLLFRMHHRNLSTVGCDKDIHAYIYIITFSSCSWCRKLVHTCTFVKLHPTSTLVEIEEMAWYDRWLSRRRKRKG